LNSERVALICQHQLSFLYLFKPQCLGRVVTRQMVVVTLSNDGRMEVES